MSEVPTDLNTLASENWGEVLKHFEWAEQKIQEEIKKTYSILEKIAPHLFMSPEEIVEFLNKARNEEKEK